MFTKIKTWLLQRKLQKILDKSTIAQFESALARTGYILVLDTPEKRMWMNPNGGVFTIYTAKPI